MSVGSAAKPASICSGAASSCGGGCNAAKPACSKSSTTVVVGASADLARISSRRFISAATINCGISPVGCCTYCIN